MQLTQIKNPVYFGQLLHKKGFKTWFLYMFRQIEKRKFIVEELHHDLFDLYQAIYDQEVTRRNVNLPPRSAKTAMAKYFVAYCWADDARCNFIYTSFSQELLSGISRELADIIRHPYYVAMYKQNVEEENIEFNPIDEFWAAYLKEERKKNVFTATKIINDKGGVILFASIGSAITGFGAGIRGSLKFSGCLFIDDGNKPADIHSQKKRNKVKTYYEETLLSRLNQGNIPVINIQQRLHVEDLSGFLSKVYKFKTFKKPLIVDGVCQLPSQYDAKRLEEIKKNEFMFVAQYQQSPVMQGGNLFKKETIRELRQNQMPQDNEFIYRFITGDLSYKDKQSNDYSVFCYWGVAKEVINNIERNHLYLIDCIRKKINSVDVESWVEPWIKPKLTYNFRYVWIEDKSHGIYLNQAFRRKGYPVPSEEQIKKMLPRDVDKVQRANNIIPCLNKINPNLTFNKDIENYSEMKDELLSFSNSEHDDFVDNVIDGVKIGLFQNRVTVYDVL